MLRLSLIAAAAVLTAAAATLSSAQDDAPARPRTFAPVTDIEWSYGVRTMEGHDEPRLQFGREGMSTTLGTDDLPETATALTALVPGEPVSFTVAREAGVIACTGSTITASRAGGRCRFDPNPVFVAALSARGLVPEDEEELLGLAIVDARLASFDDLSHAGFAIADVDELMTVSALRVTGAYARELREGGLEPEDLDSLVSAKAVGVDPAWIAEMADAGYPHLGIDKAIELRALGVTSDYARRMARVMRATEGAE